MKRDKKGIKEKLVKWIKRIADEEIEKDEDKKHRNNHSKKCYLTKLPLIPQKKLRVIKFLVLFFLHGSEDHEINKQNMSTEPP